MYTVELCGSHAARCLELNVEVYQKKNGVIDAIARKMIEKGAKPDQLMKIVRNEKPVFREEREVGAWAAKRLYETDKQGFLERSYRLHNRGR